MRNIIETKLRDIEAAEHVRILHCVESGSRAWGFDSPDSDYDVRFVYLRQREDYLRLEETRDVIEWQLDDVLDINGWDVQKYLRLLFKSNPTVFEWAFSPIVYRTTPEWSQIAALLEGYCQPKHLLYHYLSMAKHNEQAYLRGETVALKKYFYVLRPLLAGRWVAHRLTPPPIEFDKLTAAELPAHLRETVDALIEQKRSTPEIGRGAHIPALDAFFAEELTALDDMAKTLPGTHDRSWAKLDAAFLSLLTP